MLLSQRGLRPRPRQPREREAFAQAGCSRGRNELWASNRWPKRTRAMDERSGRVWGLLLLCRESTRACWSREEVLGTLNYSGAW